MSKKHYETYNLERERARRLRQMHRDGVKKRRAARLAAPDTSGTDRKVER